MTRCNATSVCYSLVMNTAIKLIVANEGAKALPLSAELVAVSDRVVIAGAREQYATRSYYNARHHAEEHLSVDAWDAFLTFAEDVGLGVDAMADDRHLTSAQRAAWSTFSEEFESCVEMG